MTRNWRRLRGFPGKTLKIGWPTGHWMRMRLKRLMYHKRQLRPMLVNVVKFNREREMARRVRQRLPYFCFLSGEPHDGKTFCEVCDCGAFENNPLNYVPS